MINFQNSPWGFVKNMCSLLVKNFDISSKSTLFLLLSNYTCYVYLTECGVLKSSTFVFLLMLSTLTRVFPLYIVKMLHLLNQVSCNYIVRKSIITEPSCFPSNTFYPAFYVIEWWCCPFVSFVCSNLPLYILIHHIHIYSVILCFGLFLT